MRKPVKYRLIYLSIAFATYISGFLWLPEDMAHPMQPVLSYTYLGILLVALPALYYPLVVIGGKQKLWRILVPISLGVVVARYTLPDALAAHFEFISYLRYPIIAVILVIEFAVIFHVLSSLWKARKLHGDPRLHALAAHRDDERKQSMAVMAASEPASYYYAIPFLSRNHPPALTNLTLLSAARWHIALVLSLLAVLTVFGYFIIAQFSAIAAIIVTTVLCWSSVSLIASHRISRYYSLYLSHGHLMVNASFYNVICVPVADISGVEAGSWTKDSLADALAIGRGDTFNLRLRLYREVNWLTMMGLAVEPVSEIYLNVESPERLCAALQKEVNKNIGLTQLRQAV